MMTINKKFMHKKNYLFLLVLIATFSISCMDKSGLQQTNTYPVEIFSEMHYSQAYKSQEPPRLEPAKSSVVFQKSSDETLVISKNKIIYDELSAENLYRINCSMCHGINLDGNGSVAKYITSKNGIDPYEKSPPNLIESAKSDTYPNIKSMVLFIQDSGKGPMPKYSKLLNESEIYEIVSYIFKSSGRETEEK